MFKKIETSIIVLIENISLFILNSIWQRTEQLNSEQLTIEKSADWIIQDLIHDKCQQVV